MKKTLLITVALAFVTCAQAALLSPVSTTGTGAFNHDTSLISNGVTPTEGSGWTNATNVWWNGTAPVFTMDFGAIYTIAEVLLSFDNNDSYGVTYSENGSSWSSLFTVLISDGEVGGGMDTMSSELGHGEYVSGIDFTAVSAQYIRIQALSGDNNYSIGEFQAYGTMPQQGVPDSGSTALLALGAFGLLATIRRQLKK